MPRLEGKKSNTGLYVLLLLVIVVVALVLVQYLGFVHIIPNFGIG